MKDPTASYVSKPVRPVKKGELIKKLEISLSDINKYFKR